MKDQETRPSILDLADRLKNTVSAFDVATRLGVKLTPEGDRYRGRCPLPTHGKQTGRTPGPLAVYRDPARGFFCYGCQTGGSVIDLYGAITGLAFPDAVRDMASAFGITAAPAAPVAPAAPRRKASTPAPAAWEPSAEPDLETLRNFPGRPDFHFGAAWQIRDRSGRLFAAHVRFNAEPDQGIQGCKASVPWWRDGRWKLSPHSSKQAPLYGSERVIPDGRPVWLTEGEKCADALREASGFQVLGACAGVPDPEVLDAWQDLREVVLWPDHDEHGRALMDGIGAEFLSRGCVVRWFDPAAAGVELPDKSDAFDWLARGGDVEQLADTGALPRLELRPPEEVTKQDPRRCKLVTAADLAPRDGFDLERSFIAALLTDPARARSVDLAPRDLSNPAAREAFAALQDLGAGASRELLRARIGPARARELDLDRLTGGGGLDLTADALRASARSSRLEASLAEAWTGLRLGKPTEAVAADVGKALQDVAPRRRCSMAERLDRREEDLCRRAQYAAQYGPIRGIETGFAALDHYFGGGLLRDRMTVLLGSPGAGKSTLARHIAMRAAGQEVPSIVYSYENSADGIVDALILQEMGGTYGPHDLAAGLVPLRAYQEARDRIEHRLSFLDLQERNPEITVQTMRAAIEATTPRSDFRPRVLVILDYLQMHARSAAVYQSLASVRERVDAALADLTALRDSGLGAHFLVLSSVGRQADYKSGRLTRATLDGAKESGEVEFAADAMLVLTRPEEGTENEGTMGSGPNREHTVTAALLKNRYGPTGHQDLAFSPRLGTFRGV